MSDENKTPDLSNDMLRQIIMDTFNQNYSNIITFINRFNLHPILKSHGFMNLDQGAYWLREAIKSFNPEPPAAPVENVTPIVNPVPTEETDKVDNVTLDSCQNS